MPLTLICSILVLQLFWFHHPSLQLYMIKGRVVNSKGAPVKNALIYYAQEDSNYSEGTYEGARSDDHGTFSLPIEAYMKLRPFHLFVTTDIPKDAVTLMFPPFTLAPPHIRRQLAGPRIVLNESLEVDIGDVPLKVVYDIININILDVSSHPKQITLKQWSDFVVRLLDQSGSPIASAGLSHSEFEKSVSSDKSAIKVAVPKGFRKFEVSLSGFDGPFFSSSLLAPKLNGSPQAVYVKIP